MSEKPKFKAGEQRTLDAIYSNPGKTDKEIAEILGWTVLTVRSSTAVLESAREISVDIRGLTETYYPFKQPMGLPAVLAPVASSPLSNILTEVLKKNGVQASRDIQELL